MGRKALVRLSSLTVLIAGKKATFVGQIHSIHTPNSDSERLVPTTLFKVVPNPVEPDQVNKKTAKRQNKTKLCRASL